ncbi:hypothetical protein [Paenibacillus thiaminolyticus]|nr:hypothetical protein [Paenibacillus thiaminolyticus]MCY9616878.1 hypothetical protein [Paenibacillus thiaminolyticus]MCY9633158.1 hypothetical protein [Paenibacillus thiaminolyticus]MCY9644175.1 hypothetical protein [Paenibacillus thiaminolyticus]MCY9743533.1 hypothetical protein [Paenibacillus thiaminolyticus]MEC0065704.1 hypothetical protein [Paenibacillus thiaminolyticus]
MANMPTYLPIDGLAGPWSSATERFGSRAGGRLAEAVAADLKSLRHF